MAVYTPRVRALKQRERERQREGGKERERERWKWRENVKVTKEGNKLEVTVLFIP